MMALEQPKKYRVLRRKRPFLASRRTGLAVVVSQALVLLTRGCAFQLQPPISPPSAKLNHGCGSARRAPGPGRGRVVCPTTTSAENRRATTAIAAGADGGEDSFAEDQRYRRKPKGSNLRRDEGGLPTEKVYAPRQSA